MEIRKLETLPSDVVRLCPGMMSGRQNILGAQAILTVTSQAEGASINRFGRRLVRSQEEGI